MNWKKWTLLVVMMGVLLATAFANDGNGITKKRTDFIKERKAYFKEHIKPKVDAQRKILETSLTGEDKTEIARLREEIIKQRLLQNEFMYEARASHIKGEDVDEDLILELQAQRVVIENLRDHAKIIANKYRPEIDDLVANLKGFNKGSGKGMIHHNKTTNNNRGADGGRGIYGQSNSGRRGNGFGNGSLGDFDMVTFLLWNVNRG